MTFVTVYRFKIWNSETERFVPSLRMGTRAAIAIVRGEIIEGSGTEVPIAQVDAKGFTLRNVGNLS